jgi:prolipoprotein diacylglyceryltransferase
MTTYLAWWIGGGFVGLTAAAFALRRTNALSGATIVSFAMAGIGCLYGAKVQYRLRFEGVLDAIAVPPGELFTPGFHIPLGLVVGFAAAMLVARLLRSAPLRTADALGLAGAVMMPIGRIGCLVAGCCTGVVCPWWWPFGVVRGPDSNAYNDQLASGLIVASAPVSLPVHPLAAYFAVLGVVVAAIELRLFRRGVRAGAIAAIGFLLYPLGQLLIEQLRIPTDDRGPVMTSVLLAMIVCDLLIVSGVAWYESRRRGHGTSILPRITDCRRRPPGRGAWDVAAWPLVAVTTVVALGSLAYAADTAPSWAHTLARYVQDPVASRRAMIAIGRRDDATLSPLARLAVADAHLRSGHMRTAGRMFEAVMADDPDGPWYGIAALGRGWTAASRGRMDEARSFFADAAGVEGSTGLLGDFMVGMIDAGTGDPDALERFARVASDADAPEGLRSAAMLAQGYAKFWAGDDAGAGMSFAAMEADDGGSVTDNARYAAALVQWRGEHRNAAEATLRELAATGPREHTERQPHGLVGLDPRSLLRASARRYRRLPLRMPVDQVTDMMAIEVAPLARLALHEIAAGQAAPRPLGERAAAVAASVRHAGRGSHDEDSRLAHDAIGRPVRAAAHEPAFPTASFAAVVLLGAVLSTIYGLRARSIR